MFWWKKIAVLKKQFNEVQSELQKEQGKASRLTGFLTRLQTFAIAQGGQIPQWEFAEAFPDSVHSLMNGDQVLLFRTDPDTFDLSPAAGRGFSPEILSKWHVRLGEGVLGQAAQNLKTVVASSETGGEVFHSNPCLVIRRRSQ